MLQTLNLTIHQLHIDALKKLTMSALRDFSLRVDFDVVDGIMLDKILRNFTFPCLSKLKLSISLLDDQDLGHSQATVQYARTSRNRL